MKQATQLSHPQADVQPGSPAMQAMVTRQCPLLLMPRTTMMASNVEQHENSRTTASNTEHHENTRTVPRTMAMAINIDNTNTRTTTVAKVPPLSVIGSKSMVAIIPEHVVKVLIEYYRVLLLIHLLLATIYDIFSDNISSEKTPI